MTYGIVRTRCGHMVSSHHDPCATCKIVPGRDTKCRHERFPLCSPDRPGCQRPMCDRPSCVLTDGKGSAAGKVLCGRWVCCNPGFVARLPAGTLRNLEKLTFDISCSVWLRKMDGGGSLLDRLWFWVGCLRHRRRNSRETRYAEMRKQRRSTCRSKIGCLMNISHERWNKPTMKSLLPEEDLNLPDKD